MHESQHGGDVWTRWRGSAIPTLAIAGPLLLAFRGALAGRMFYLRDISQNHYPIRRFVTERMRAGALPLWDPYHGGGTPLLANPNALALHPISTLFLALPFDAAFTASIVLQFLLLAWGGYLLARRVTASREAASLAAVVMALSGPAVSLASLQNVLSAAAWVPLGVWAFLRGLDPGGSRWLALSALLLAIVLMTGEPASLLSFALLGAVLGSTASVATTDHSPARRTALALLLVGTLALLIASVQIVPARELLGVAVRGHGFPPEEGMKWSLEPARLLEIVMPWLFGDPTRLSPQAWWGAWRFEGSYPFLLSIYIGAVPCLLAALGLVGRGAGAGRRWSLGAIASGGLLLALGRHDWLDRSLFATVPVFRQFRYPERFLIIFLFAVALLAAIGLDRLLHEAIPSRRRAILALFAAAAVTFVAVTLIASFPSLIDRLLLSVARVPPALLQSESGPAVRGAILRSALWMFGEAALLALGAALAFRAPGPVSPGRHRLAALGAFIPVAVSGLSLAFASGPVLSTAAPEWLSMPSPLAGAVPRGPGAPRLHHDPRPSGLQVWAKTDELIWGYRFDRFTYALGTGHADHVPTILDAATDQMDLRDQVELGRSLARLSPAEMIRVLAVCGAGGLVTSRTLESPDLEPIPLLEAYSLPPTRVYRIRSVPPRARFVPRSAPLSHPGDLASSIADQGWDPSRTVLLETAPEGGDGDKGGGPAGEGAGTAIVTEDEPEGVAIQVDAASAGYLVLSDSFAPGWRATVDGQEARLLRANGLFRAVAVPAGSHEVRMAYHAPGLAAGFGLTLVGLAAAGGWWARAGRRRS